MRILGFSRKWQKLSNPEFTTFRYPRSDFDWYVGEQVRIIIQPHRKGGGEVLGIAEVINKEIRELDKEYYEAQEGVPLITETEAIADGFSSIDDMVNWLEKTYGRLDFVPRMNKLTLRFIDG